MAQKLGAELVDLDLQNNKTRLHILISIDGVPLPSMDYVYMESYYKKHQLLAMDETAFRDAVDTILDDRTKLNIRAMNKVNTSKTVNKTILPFKAGLVGRKKENTEAKMIIDKNDDGVDDTEITMTTEAIIAEIPLP